MTEKADAVKALFFSRCIEWSAAPERFGAPGCEELECGDIGIFVYDDCGYLKKYDEHTPDKTQAEFLTDSYGVVHNQPVLVSLNTKYSPIIISPEQRFEIVGKVLN